MDALAAIVGLGVGVVVGLTSMGGGALLTPALVFVLGIPPSVAVGSDVLIASVMKLFGGGIYAKDKQVHWRTVWRLAAGSIPGGVLGILILNRMSDDLIDQVVGRGLGVAILIATVCTVYRLVRQRPADSLPWPGVPFTMMLGFATGLLVAITSVGSGSLLICVLFFFFPLTTRTMVGTDLVHALVLSAAVTAGHGLSGRVDLVLAGSVLVGAIPGVIVGSKLSGIIPERTLRAGLAIVLAVVGLRLVLGPAKKTTLNPVAPAVATETLR